MQALALGLVTVTPDALDWNDEVRLAIEERTSLSPDALTGMEASLRFGPGETLETRVFARLSAWQNWIFIRPNAVGEAGARGLERVRGLRGQSFAPAFTSASSGRCCSPARRSTVARRTSSC